MLKRYGFFGFIRLIVSLLYTKLFFRNARLIRVPFDIRNRKLIKIGREFTSGFNCRLEAHPVDGINSLKLIIGEQVEMNDYVHIAAGELVQLGNNVLIASRVFITDLNHGNYGGENPDSPFSKPNDRKLSTSPVIIGDNVWIGENVCILPGVNIGAGSVIGASSVVNKSIPENCIAVGNPVRIVKKYNTDLLIWEKYISDNK